MLKATILRATSSDFDLAKQAVSLSLSTSKYKHPLDDVSLRQFLSHQDHHLLLAILNTKVVGSLYGYALRSPYRPALQFFLYGIDVQTESRNQGIGTALVNEFIAEARRAKACEVWVLTNEANRSAMKMYSNAGLRPSGAGDVMFELSLLPA